MYVKMQNKRDNLTSSNEVLRRIQLAMIYGSMADTIPDNRLERLLDELDLLFRSSGVLGFSSDDIVRDLFF
jgi:hypothetical protein